MLHNLLTKLFGCWHKYTNLHIHEVESSQLVLYSPPDYRIVFSDVKIVVCDKCNQVKIYAKPHINK